MAVGLYVFFTRTKFGLAVLATTSDPDVARLLGRAGQSGVPLRVGVGGLLSGLAAALLASGLRRTSRPSGRPGSRCAALAGAVIGGLDSVSGAIVGSLIVGVVEALAQAHAGAGVDSVLVLVSGARHAVGRVRRDCSVPRLLR